MICQKCASNRMASLTANIGTYCKYEYGTRVSDCCPSSLTGIGGEDGGYISFSYCLDCGTIQGTWPIPEKSMRTIFPAKRCKVCRKRVDSYTRCGGCGKPICATCASGISSYCSERCRELDEDDTNDP